MLRRILSLATKEFIHLINDWWMPAFMLVGGAMELLLVGWATSRPLVNLPLMVLDQDRTSASRAVVVALENTGTFALQGWAADIDTLQSNLDSGAINAALIIPPGFGDELAAPTGKPQLGVWLNGAESLAATASSRAIAGAVQELGQRIALQRLGVREEDFPSFDASLRVWFNEALSEALYTTPAESALMLEFTVLLFAALAFARERELGTLEQLLVMPFSSLEIIIGKSIPAVLIGVTDFGIMLNVVHYVFKVPIRGSLSLLFILAFGYVLVELSKGLVISVISHTQHQAFLLVMMVGMMDFMFTGYAAPVESMPQAMQLFANVIPAHHWLTIVRGIMLKGAGLRELWPHVVALMILSVVIITFSLRYVRRALD